MATVAFLHAHPDDEAIFTGGTLARLAAAGHRTVVIVATDGDQGRSHDGPDPLGQRRRDETITACSILGVERVCFLGFGDSGLTPRPGSDSFAATPTDQALRRLAEELGREHVDALVTYDEGGIYGHPDHLAIHRLGHAAAAALGVTTLYDATVDREYLHFVETHLVGHAVQSLHEHGDPWPVGMPTVLVDATIDVNEVLERKRRSIAAHASQIPDHAEPLTMPADTFAAVYGYEWYVRHGPRGALDEMTM